MEYISDGLKIVSLIYTFLFPFFAIDTLFEKVLVQSHKQNITSYVEKFILLLTGSKRNMRSKFRPFLKNVEKCLANLYVLYVLSTHQCSYIILFQHCAFPTFYRDDMLTVWCNCARSQGFPTWSWPLFTPTWPKKCFPQVWGGTGIKVLCHFIVVIYVKFN